mmetsp:Transcript_103989/g.233466  ORF Transcript_103989/g.233466 Transcript_103989/m.233466 type:complete len:301 (-) Transcript_103989:1693-2595(-)
MRHGRFLLRPREAVHGSLHRPLQHLPVLRQALPEELLQKRVGRADVARVRVAARQGGGDRAVEREARGRHRLRPLLGSRRIASCGARIQQGEVGLPAWGDPSRGHLADERLGCLDVALASEAGQEHVVGPLVGREALDGHPVHPPLCGRNVVRPQAALHDRPDGGDIRPVARGEHLLQPLLRAQDVSLLRKGVDGRSEHLLVGLEARVVHLLEPIEHVLGVALSGDGVEHQRVCLGVRLHARLLHLAVPRRRPVRFPVADVVPDEHDEGAPLRRHAGRDHALQPPLRPLRLLRIQQGLDH